MNTNWPPKVRVVRCPKCRCVLFELPDIPVYKCGGCDTVLQAKYWKGGVNGVGLGLQNTDSSQLRELDRPSEDGEPSNSRHEETTTLSRVSTNNEKEQMESEDHGREGGVCANLTGGQKNALNDVESLGFSTEVCAKGEFSHCELSDREVEEGSMSSSPEAISPSSGECIIDLSNERDQTESEDSSSEQLVRRKYSERQMNARNNAEFHDSQGEQSRLSYEVCSEKEFVHHENGNLGRDPLEEVEGCISNYEATIPSSGECTIDPYDQTDQKEYEDCSGDLILKDNRSNDESQTYAHHDNESSGRDRDHTETKETNISSHEETAIPFSGSCILDPNDHKENGVNHCEQAVHKVFSEHRKSSNDNDESHVCHGEQSELSHQVSSLNEFVNHEDSEILSKDPLEDEVLLSGDECLEADDNKVINSDFQSSSTLNHLATSPPVITADVQMRSNDSSETLALVKQVEEPEEITNHDFKHRSSVDKFESLKVNQCSERSSRLHGIAKSPTTKSSPAYDGSVSSCDELDDQLLDHQTHSLKENKKVANFIAQGDGIRREKLRMKDIEGRDSEVLYEAQSSQTMNISEEKRYAGEYLKKNQGALLQLQHGRRDFRTQNRNRLMRERYQTKSSLLERDHLGGYETGSTACSMFDDEFHDSRMYSPDNFVDHNQDKVRLWRIVHELQDQLEKTCALNGKKNGIVPVGSTEENSWASMSYNHQIPQEESWNDSEYPRYLERSRPRTNYPRQHYLSRMTSAAKAVSGPQIGRYHMEHLPENCTRSMQLLPSEHWHNRGPPLAYVDHESYGYYDSCQSTPQHYRNSQLPTRGSHTKFENVRHQNHEMNYLREKGYVVKHHIRPMAGGAPFISCHYCLKLLQMPTEFLLFNRRCNRVKCGHCSKILKFSLRRKSHISPYALEVAEPTPTEADEHSIQNQRAMTTSEYYAYDGPIPMSSSGDYSLATINKNGTKEGDHSMSLEKELVLKLTRNKIEKSEKRNQSRGPPERGSSRGPTERGSSGGPTERGSSSIMASSPLHRLMGYSSLSQVFDRFEIPRRSAQKKNKGTNI